MKVLLTNDDGINASGLLALYQEMKQIAEVLIVAPETEQSAVGHAITLSDPLKVTEMEIEGQFYGYMVKGTPADCVRVGIKAIMTQPPDLIISGINLGANIGYNVLYSGTVSAATEGMLLNIPSIALSLATFDNPDYSYAAKLAAQIAPLVIQNGLPPGVILNINVPAVKEDEIRGISISRHGQFRYEERFEQREAPRKKVYYWAIEYPPELKEEEDSDAEVLKQNKVSITPIRYDLTDMKSLQILKEWKIET